MKPLYGVGERFRNRGAAKRIVLIALAVVVVIALSMLVWLAGGPGPMDFANGPKVNLTGYKGTDPTGAPASMAQTSLVERGEYLARAADCMVCHTAEGGQAYGGGFAFTLPFGTLYSTNITPDKETGIGAYSDAEFLNAVRRGVRRDGTHLYPAMPFTSYSYMTDADVLAVKAYLFSLAPVNSPARPDTFSFPFNQRWLMSIWSGLFNADTRFQPNTSQSPEWNRGAYIAEALAHCGECHTPRNLASGLNERQKFAGAIVGGWRAYNISGDKATGVGQWSDEELFDYLFTGYAAGHGTASGSMGEAVEHGLSRMVPEDIHALVAYLRSVPAVTSSDLPAALAPPAPSSHKAGPASADARGKQVFEGACVHCHGWTGESPITPFATLTGARSVNDPSAVNVAQIVILGTKRTTPHGIVAMPAFGETHSNAEIAAVANYVTARFGSDPAKITAEQVAELRQQSAQ